jgi:hypothetical protein
MGGRGSGGHNSKGKLRDVQCARLEVHELARERKLKLGTRGWLFGTIWFEVIGGPDAQQLVAGVSSQIRQRRALGLLAADHWLLLAQSAFWRATPHVLVQRRPPLSARPLCSLCQSPHLVFQLPQMRWRYLSWATHGTARRVV